VSFRRKPDLPAPAMRALVTRLLEPGIRIERTLEGGSTQVYRLVRGAEVLYLRVAEEAGESMAPEAEVHTRLLAAGVSRHTAAKNCGEQNTSASHRNRCDGMRDLDYQGCQPPARFVASTSTGASATRMRLSVRVTGITSFQVR
jgi:hypothetical protein